MPARAFLIVILAFGAGLFVLGKFVPTNAPAKVKRTRHAIVGTWRARDEDDLLVMIIRADGSWKLTQNNRIAGGFWSEVTEDKLHFTVLAGKSSTKPGEMNFQCLFATPNEVCLKDGKGDFNLIRVE